MSEDGDNFTEAQKAAFSQIEEIMREHFEGGVFRVIAEINDYQDESRGSYSGGKAQAIGLLAIQTHELLNKEPDPPP